MTASSSFTRLRYDVSRVSPVSADRTGRSCSQVSRSKASSAKGGCATNDVEPRCEAKTRTWLGSGCGSAPGGSTSSMVRSTQRAARSISRLLDPRRSASSATDARTRNRSSTPGRPASMRPSPVASAEPPRVRYIASLIRGIRSRIRGGGSVVSTHAAPGRATVALPASSTGTQARVRSR